MSDSEFQADAIRTMGDLSAKMRGLLATLTTPTVHCSATPRVVQLAEGLGRWTEDLRTHVPGRIRLETELNEAGSVTGDPEQLRSVLQNLVINAIEATDGSGRVLIETRQENGHAILAVSDSGKGMSREFMEQKLFRPFQTTKRRGLGIGLYQCRHIVEGLGGTLTAESEEGRGTRMTVRLPVVKTADRGQLTVGGEPEPAGS
jgi:signal transduction histidine kinase